MFGTFGKNLKVENGCHFFSKSGIVYCLDTPRVENFDEIAVSRMMKEIETFLCFATIDKN